MKRLICLLLLAAGSLMILAACTDTPGDESKTHTETHLAEQTREIDADMPEELPAEEEPAVTEELMTVPETGIFDTDDDGGIDLPFVPFAD